MIKKFRSRRGFTLAELIIVVAIIAILAGIAFAFINPRDITYVEYNRSAEAIATAVQNRLTEIRNTGDMERLRSLGEQAVKEEKGGMASTALSDETYGGYRYVFSYKTEGGTTVRNADISYLLPFGTIEYEIAQNYYAIGFQSDTGMVGEVFYSEEPFAAQTAAYLRQLAGDPEARKTANVGYYAGDTYDEEIAFANLPTPQLTVTNYETLTLSIYLPKVKQLDAYGKTLGLLISLSDKDGEAEENGLTSVQTAIYSTFAFGSGTEIKKDEDAIVFSQVINSGSTYTMMLDAVNLTDSDKMDTALGENGATLMPKGTFEKWARKTGAFKDGYLLLGDNAKITVTVYCMKDSATGEQAVDPTFMPRSASVLFNGWFNNYSNSSVDIACGRHLQNLANLADLRQNMQGYLPTYTVDGSGNYTYGNYNYGMADAYTYHNSHGSPATSNTDIEEKYDFREEEVTKTDGTKSERREIVKHFKTAKQVNAIDFDCEEWKIGGKNVPFKPICLPSGFSYYGNYLTISNLYVDAPFYAGLFGYANEISLYDVMLVDPSVKSNMPAHIAELYEMGVGALIGTSRDSEAINNCQAFMTQKNFSSADPHRVVGEGYVGGLIGFCEDEHIANCSASVCTGYKRGAVLTSKYVGGLVGSITGDSDLDDCYAAGSLSGEYVGGLVGNVVEDSDPSGDDYQIHTCYTAGHIEWAQTSAAGILGHAGGYGGNPKAALNISGNYCVVIYGEKHDGSYVWESSAPIYGTFEGDGFEWIHTHDFHYGDDYLKGKYANFTYFAGATFENINKNYYIAQRGIRYSNSPYFDSMSDTVQDLLVKIEDKTSDKTALTAEVDAAIEKTVWLKKLQTLDKLKELMETIIYEVENEKGVDSSGRAYNKAGYHEKGTDFYLDLSRARVEGVNNEKGHTYSEALTLIQALHAMYDGTYKDDEGNEHTVTMLYDGSDGTKKLLRTTYGFTNYTFMDYYNFLQKTYDTLLDDGKPEAEKTAAREALKVIFGDNTKEVAYTTEGKDDDGNSITIYTYFYQTGLFYECFESDLLYRLFDKAKDYYQTDKGDKTGELIYRYFRDLVSDDFCELLCDLGMADSERDKMLENVKQTQIQEAIDAMKEYPNITAKWTGPMKDDKDTANGYASAAQTALEKLLAELQKGSYTVEEIQPLIDAADDALGKLYDLLDEHKSKKDGATEDPGDWDAVDKDGTLGDMRKLRDPVSEFRRYAALCTSTANSGVENALKVLKTKLGKTSADPETLVEEFKNSVNTYLGRWGDDGSEPSDSGYRLKNSTEVRNAARGYIHGDDSKDASGNYIDTKESSLGFMYDYGNSYKEHSKEINPYYKKVDDDSYVDQDNNIYNNVFPYTAGVDKTSFYPFPFVFAREVEGGSRVLYVLFHYGDWLTPDLWLENVDPATAALEEMAFELNTMTYLSSIKTGQTDDQMQKRVDDLENAVHACISTVNGALKKTGEEQKTQLKTISGTINGWLSDGGALAALEKECTDTINANGSAAKKATAQTILNNLTMYRRELEKLLEKIAAVTGS